MCQSARCTWSSDQLVSELLIKIPTTEPKALDEMDSRLKAERDSLKEDKLMVHQEFLVNIGWFTITLLYASI